MFDHVFSSFKSCAIDILEEDVRINSDMGTVCTVRRVNIVLKSGETKQALVRQTGCFERAAIRGSSFMSMPPSPPWGEWDGKIIAG
jgi:hypothetical protein